MPTFAGNTKYSWGLVLDKLKFRSNDQSNLDVSYGNHEYLGIYTSVLTGNWFSWITRNSTHNDFEVQLFIIFHNQKYPNWPHDNMTRHTSDPDECLQLRTQHHPRTHHQHQQGRFGGQQPSHSPLALLPSVKWCTTICCCWASFSRLRLQDSIWTPSQQHKYGLSQLLCLCSTCCTAHAELSGYFYFPRWPFEITSKHRVLLLLSAHARSAQSAIIFTWHCNRTLFHNLTVQRSQFVCWCSLVCIYGEARRILCSNALCFEFLN